MKLEIIYEAYNDIYSIIDTTGAVIAEFATLDEAEEFVMGYL
jgi:hypothetical protein